MSLDKRDLEKVHVELPKLVDQLKEGKLVRRKSRRSSLPSFNWSTSFGSSTWTFSRSRLSSDIRGASHGGYVGWSRKPLYRWGHQFGAVRPARRSTRHLSTDFCHRTSVNSAQSCSKTVPK